MLIMYLALSLHYVKNAMRITFK